ncbi:hypothetical protein CW354_04160 [Marinicaulis flavus]|uniref:DUF6438 domain-containing protein n=1 Tax=Hyphococcus luteus TaxID=2058213 RepID=A0A2S7K9H1_9PROT|nr:hypothetical protein CW354_04160 [Marinicaulis flavus]
MTAALLSACSTEGYQPYATRGLNTGQTENYDEFTLKRTACYGFCPVYEVRVDERDVLVFKGEQFVKEDQGTVSKRLPEGSFKKLVEIARAHDFSSYDAAYPNADGSNCPQRATDMPSVIVSYDAKKLSHSVSLYQGCMGFDGRERLDEMILEIDAVLDLDDFIGPREAFYGAEEKSQ